MNQSTMATDLPTLAQLLDASLDPRTNKQGEEISMLHSEE